MNDNLTVTALAQRETHRLRSNAPGSTSVGAGARGRPADRRHRARAAGVPAWSYLRRGFYAAARAIAAVLLLSPATAMALWQEVSPDLALACGQSSLETVYCEYRLTRSDAAVDITASAITGTELPVSGTGTFPWDDATTAILILIDTSDPGREDVVRTHGDQIRTILKASKPYYRFALASFDKELRIQAPMGSTAGQIVAAARKLRAAGMTTELYRSLLQAIDFLRNTSASRRVIYLLSDGQAEDKAYFHDDVVKAAQRNGIVINSLGFARSTARSVALQTLRRLSEESGGVFVEADRNHRLPESFLSHPFRYLDNGGRFLVDLQPLLDAGMAPPAINITFSLAGNRVEKTVPVTLPRPQAAARASPPPVQAQPPAPVVNYVEVPQPAPDGPMDRFLWYGVPVALFILILLTLVTFFLLYRRLGARSGKPGTAREEQKPFAYLISQEEKPKRYPITSTVCRIGRSRENELTLDDNSVSRRHAEIQRYNNGKFVLFDRDSTNGVYVNNEQVEKHRLQEGDIIEIGDVYLRFTQVPQDFQLAEKTAVQDTKAPVTH